MFTASISRNIFRYKNLFVILSSITLSFFVLTLAASAATTISTSITTDGDLTVNGNSTIGNAVADSITANGYFTQVRIGTGSTFGNIGTVGADELGVEGDVEIDGTAWFDGILQASSTALFGSGVTFYGNLTVAKSATTTVTFSDKGINFDSNTLVLDPNANRVGVLTSTPNTEFEVVGTASSTSLVIGGGTSISRHLSSSASLDFGVISATGCSTLTVTVTGAADGDVVSLGAPTALANASTTFQLTGFVSAADTVSVRLCQNSVLGSSDPAAATVRADVWKH